MRVWLRHHAQSLATTLARLARQPTATCLNAAAIGVALALPFGAYVVLDNSRVLARDLAGTPQMTVFLALEADRADADKVEAELRQGPLIRRQRFVPRAQALAELKRSDAFAEIVATLGSNPLPDAFVVDLAPGQSAAAETLAARLRALPAVAQVQLDAAWVRRLEALLGVGRTSVAVLATFLAVGLVAVTFNTVRLQIVTQAAEIEVSRLVGATDGQVRRPFLYLGTVLGVLGALLAIVAVAVSVRVLNDDVTRLAATYGSDFRLTLPAMPDLAAVVAFAATLGWLGAYLSVSRHLRET